MDNSSAVLYGKEDLRIEQRPLPVEPRDNEVLLKIICVGICGSDLHFYQKARIAQFIVDKPLILGHEGSGIVEKVGRNVTNLKPGDRVAIEPGSSCLTCSYCKSGRPNLCPNIAYCGTPPHNGLITRYACHRADCCFKLPDRVSLEEGAMLQPLSIGIHGCRTSSITVGDRLLILGAGNIGLVTLLAARTMGATTIICTDLLDYKLTKARELGASHVINPRTFNDAGNLREHIRMLFGGMEPNKTIDCVGSEETIRLGMEITRRAGVLCIIGLEDAEVTIPLTFALRRGVVVRGIFRYCNDYPLALDMVTSGRVDVKTLITHRYRLEDTVHGIETLRTARGNAIKVMIHCDENCGK